MNRPVTLVVLAIAALLGASAASAKGPSQGTVCGRSIELPTARACLTFTERSEILYQLLDQGEPFSLRGPPRPAPYYTVAFRFPEGNRWNWWFLYVPSRGVVRVTTSVGTVTGTRTVYWRRAPTPVSLAFETLSKQLRPFPAPRRWR